MNSLHTRLRETFRWYHNWHEHPRHKHTHWLSFLVAVLSVFSFISGQVNFPLEEFNVVVPNINTAEAQTTFDPTCIDPAPNRSVVPDMSSVVQAVFDEDINRAMACDSTFVEEVVRRLRSGTGGTRWSFEGVRSDLDRLWLEGISYYYGPGNAPRPGTTDIYEVFAIDILHQDCTSSNPADFWADWGVVDWPDNPLGVVNVVYKFITGPEGNATKPPEVLCRGRVTPTPSPRPRFIYFLVPNVVQAGNVVTIEGSNLYPTIRATNAAGTVATLNGTMNASGTIVTFTVPAGSPPGNYSVRVGPSATDQSNAVGIEVLTGTAPPIITGTEPPVITSINPTTVRWGDSFQIFGEFLSPNVQIIDGNGTSTNILGNVNDGNTIVTVFISSNFQPGIYNVGVTNNNGSVLANDILTITETQVETNETITTLEIPPASDFGDLVSGAYNYSLILVGLVVFIMFMWAGFLWVTSAANPGNIGTAKMYMTNAIAGAVLLISAFLILNTINPGLRSGGFEVPGISAGPGPGGGSTQTAAQRLLSMTNVSFSTNASCGGNYHASQNIQDMAAGGMPAVCTSGSCTPCVAGGASGSIYVFPQILNGLSDLAELGTSFTVTSFTTGNHMATSYHYQGRAVDINNINGTNSGSAWVTARGFLDDMGGNAICEDPGDPDNDQRGPGGLIVTQDDPDCVSSGMSHIHWQY